MFASPVPTQTMDGFDGATARSPMLVVAWSSTYCDRPVYHSDAKVIFPPMTGVTITNMGVKTTVGGVESWTDLGAFDLPSPPSPTRVFDGDGLYVKNANH